MKTLAIVAATSAYGFVHEPVTARACFESFSFRHAMVFPAASPTLLGLGRSPSQFR